MHLPIVQASVSPDAQGMKSTWLLGKRKRIKIWVWWYMPALSAFGRIRQEDGTFWWILDYAA